VANDNSGSISASTAKNSWWAGATSVLAGGVVTIVASFGAVVLTNQLNRDAEQEQFIRNQRITAYGEFIDNATLLEATIGEAVVGYLYDTSITAENYSPTDLINEIEGARTTFKSSQTQLSLLASDRVESEARYVDRNLTKLLTYLTPKILDSTWSSGFSEQNNYLEAITCYATERRDYFTEVVRYESGIAKSNPDRPGCTVQAVEDAAKKESD
jgi:hypothetical protein